MEAARMRYHCTNKQCETCDTVPPELMNISHQPDASILIGDVVQDARGMIWVITHYYDFFKDTEITLFYRIGADKECNGEDICWCAAGDPENPKYDIHIESDPHGPFTKLYVGSSE